MNYLNFLILIYKTATINVLLLKNILFVFMIAKTTFPINILLIIIVFLFQIIDSKNLMSLVCILQINY